MPVAGKALRVEVVYAMPDRQVLEKLDVPDGTTVGEAIARSGIPGRFPRLRIASGQVGIFGRLVDLDAPLREGDRIELYRPLIADPKQARRERAKGAGKRSRQ